MEQQRPDGVEVCRQERLVGVERHRPLQALDPGGEGEVRTDRVPGADVDELVGRRRNAVAQGHEQRHMHEDQTGGDRQKGDPWHRRRKLARSIRDVVPTTGESSTPTFAGTAHQQRHGPE